MRKPVLGALAVLALAAGGAKADATLEEIGRQCGLQLRLSDKGCTCIVDRASDELNDTQRRFVVAKVTENQEAERNLSLSPAEMQEVIAFIQTAPQSCAP